ncbi:flagellar protein FlaG [Orenia metallireducens]|uniref:Flagellar protein FlaG n=1 Tax=Orenia metallireducens TaxID=1413210 RepID=A0A285GBC0_9FIRM|nr:flagellar protein FlaG [Orenia metallireducens]PRX32591.1 flagellar protein FlaG [Orenia metallireducens]SNY20745.1 flagellar protein FlaG [Orenia metallireducens]
MSVSEVNNGNNVNTIISKPSNIENTAVKETNKDDNLLERKQNQLTKDKLQEDIESLNEAVKPFQQDLKFEIHEKSKRMMVKVMDLKKHKVIKELPPKEVLDMLGKIREMVGLIIDEKI